MLKGDFRDYLVQKSTPTIMPKDIVCTAFTNSSKVIATYSIPVIVMREELKRHLLEINSGKSTLGPGRYLTPPPPAGPSFNFGYAPRFKNLIRSSTPLTKSTDKIKENKNLEKYLPINKSNTSRERFQKKKVTEAINKKTKNILQIEKRIKVQGKINEKYERIEKRKNKFIRNEIASSFACLMVAVMMPHVLHKKFKRFNQKMLKVNALKKRLRCLCTAIGKFLIIKKNIKTKFAWKIFKKKLPHLLKEKLYKIKISFSEIITNFVGEYIKNCNFMQLNLSLRSKIIKIQANIKKFLKVTRFRKLIISGLWEKFDTNKEKVGNSIKNYYISKYIQNQIKKYLDKKAKDLVNPFFLTDNDHQKLFENVFRPAKAFGPPVLKFFSRLLIRNLINQAYKEKKIWDQLPVELFSQKYDFSLSPSKVSPNIKKSPKRDINKKQKKKIRFAIENDNQKSKLNQKH